MEPQDIQNRSQRLRRSTTDSIVELLACLVAAIILTGIGYGIARIIGRWILQ